jgi:hypothetical protein
MDNKSRHWTHTHTTMFFRSRSISSADVRRVFAAVSRRRPSAWSRLLAFFWRTVKTFGRRSG